MPRIAEVAFPVPVPGGFHYLVPDGLALSPGMRVRAPFGPRRAVGTVLSVFDGQPHRPLKTIEERLDAEPLLPAELLECGLWMSRRYGAPIGECVKALMPAASRPGKRAAAAAAPQPAPAEAPFPAPAFTLTAGQAAALESLGAALAARRHETVLLFGVPASGKTEVYLRLIRQAVESGGQALFLLPEISLTAPFFAEFAAALKHPVVLWHSKLGAPDRRRAWAGLRDGSVRVVVGARSAALLPFKDLRLVVVDEEQDESFKQEGQSPTYHARDVARERARRVGALLVLGSATPSMDAWELCRRGEARRVDMPDRVSSAAKPAVRVVPAPPYGACLSAELLAALKDRLARREQAILLVNRRGFSTLLRCHKCGWVDRCEECGVAKISHQEGEGFVLRCHHCGRKASVPAKCPRCSQPALRAGGIGTQKVVQELKASLPGVKVLRMDGDTLTAETKQGRLIYERFKAKEAQILVGTKLVAKSFHFPEVTLVGVVDSDTMLHMPDFRASERTIQLLAQVAGRSGRAEKPGEVLLQTLHPHDAAISCAAAGDYGAFAERELSLRKDLGYPPFTLLIRVLWTAKDEQALARGAEEAAARLRETLGPSGCEVLGPSPAAIPLASGKFRHHLLLKVPSEDQLPAVLAAVRAAPLPTGARLKINVDPYDLF